MNRLNRFARKFEEPLVFATQGDETSYHAQAARTIAMGRRVRIIDKKKFGEVVVASRETKPGLGVIAISTVMGTVEESARSIVGQRVSTLPYVVGRVDLPVEFALIGSSAQTIEELGRHGVKCLAQKEAALQCSDFLGEHMPWVKVQYRTEATRAIKEAVAANNPNKIAIGPSSSAEPHGGVILGPSQINPPDSVTSFYVLQRTNRPQVLPRGQVLPKDPDKTVPRAVVSLAHPEGEGELAKVVEIAQDLEIGVTRVIPFGIGDYTKHDKQIRRGGGLVELAHDMDDGVVTEFCSRVAGIEAMDGVRGPFDAIKLGTYEWYPEELIDLAALGT